MSRLLILLLLTACLNAREFQITTIAAKVNGHAITQKEIDSLLAPRKEVLQALYPRRGPVYENRLKKFQTDILEQLINNELLLSEIEGKASIPDHVVDQEIKRIIRENYDGKQAEFNKFLKESGLTRRAFRERQREQILIQAFRSQQFGETPPPTEQEIRAQYNKRKRNLRDRAKDVADFQKIFIASHDRLNPDITPEQRLALAEQIHLKLKQGADFTELAKKYSDGAFASQGGLWKDAKRIDFSLSFGDAIFEESKKGSLIGPLKDPAGFTIVRILDINYGPSPSLSDKKIRERMKREINIEKRSEKYDKWINSLKEHAMIERRI